MKGTDRSQWTVESGRLGGRHVPLVSGGRGNGSPSGRGYNPQEVTERDEVSDINMCTHESIESKHGTTV